MSRKSLTTLCLSSALVLLAGCHGGTSHDRVGYDGAASWGNYKCHAVNANGGRVSVGWSSTESQARANAMEKCQSHSQGNSNCQVTECNNDM